MAITDSGRATLLPEVWRNYHSVPAWGASLTWTWSGTSATTIWAGVPKVGRFTRFWRFRLWLAHKIEPPPILGCTSWGARPK